MPSLLKKIKNFVSFDAERDFYAKHFPSVREDQSIVIFRPMKKSDITAVCEIEKLVYDFPWSEDTFHNCFKIGYSSWIMERLGEVFAYGILSFGAGEAHIMNFCISPAQQKKGFGHKLMGKMIEVAIQYRAKNMLLEVRPSNVPALNLYKKAGFDEIGERKDYYPGKYGREDAVVLEMILVPVLSEIKEAGLSADNPEI